MTSAAVQTIFKSTEHSNGFSKIDNYNIRKAINDLSGGAFKIFMFAMTCMADFQIKTKLYARKNNLNLRIVQKDFSELVKKGYARRVRIHDRATGQFKQTYYVFFESPCVRSVHHGNLNIIKKYKQNKPVEENLPSVQEVHMVPIIKEVTTKVEVTTPAAAPSSTKKSATTVIDFEIMSELKTIGGFTSRDIERLKDRLEMIDTYPDINALVKKYVLEAIEISRRKNKNNPGEYLNPALKKEPYQSILNRIEAREKQIARQTINRQKEIDETIAAKALASKTIDFQTDDDPIIRRYNQLTDAEKGKLFDEYLTTIQSESIRIKIQRLGKNEAIKKITYQIWLEAKLNENR